MATSVVPLTKDVTARHIFSFTDVSPEWELKRDAHYYQLDLKMMNLSSVSYGFTWNSAPPKHSDPPPSAADSPWRVVVFNLSMNDLMKLEHHSLKPFSQLRSLDVSLNRIDNIVGVEVCGELRRLVASHNFIDRLDGLQGCPKLVYLDLSVNLLTGLSLMPSLSSLNTLNINNNKIKNLEGIQALPHLKELRAQKNLVTHIIPLAGCFDMKIIDLSDNMITSLRITTETVSGLAKLQSLVLEGNPVFTDRLYRPALIDAVPTLLTLDHSLTRAEAKSTAKSAKEALGSDPGALGRQVALKEAARRIFLDQLADRKRLLGSNVDYLHKKIRDMQKEYEEYEEGMEKELDNCMRYLDSLGIDSLQTYDVNKLKDGAWPWQSHRGLPGTRAPFDPAASVLPVGPSGSRLPGAREEDLPALTPDTAELLRKASNKLARGHLT